MNQRFKTILVSILIFSVPVVARPIAEENFKFIKQIKFENGKPTNRVVKVELDEEIFKNSYSNDLRVSYRDQIVPYTRTRSKESFKDIDKIKPKLIFEKKEINSGMDVYVLELPALPEGYVYSNLSINNPINYETSISIYLGDNPKDWSELKSQFFYKYEDQGSKEFNLGESKYRYIRIESNIGSMLEFPYVTKSKLGKNLYFQSEISIPNFHQEEGITEYNFPNEKRVFFQRIILETKETNWERRILIRAKKDKKNWDTAFDQVVRSVNSSKTEIQLYFQAEGEFSIQIYDDENQNLTLINITLLQPKEDLYFYLPESADLSNFQLYYGNPYQWAPNFDTFSIPTKDEIDFGSYRTKLSAEIQNPNFSWSLVQPPISGYMASFLFYFGIFILLILIRSILKSKFNSVAGASNA